MVIKMNKTRPYLHYDLENSHYFHLGIVLLPLIIYGCYKNGLLPLLNNDISIFEFVRPLLFPIIGFGVGLLVDYVIWWNSKEETIFNNTPYYGVLITMTLPIHANIFVVAILLFFSFLLLNKIKKSKWKPSLLFTTRMIFFLIFSLIAHVSFKNATEQTNMVLYSLLDVFFGRNIGGIHSTSIFWMLFAFFILWFDFYYKKEIPLILIITFICFSFLFEFIFPTGNFLKAILNPSVWFAAIFYATDSTSSPYTESGKIIYAVSIGILCFFITRWFSEQEGIYISIFIISLLVNFIDSFAYKLEKKNKKFCRFLILKKENFIKQEAKKFEIPKLKKESL